MTENIKPQPQTVKQLLQQQAKVIKDGLNAVRASKDAAARSAIIATTTEAIAVATEEEIAGTTQDLVQFFELAAEYAPLSQAQLFQDLWVFLGSGKKQGGYFVEFGAANGKRLSNTYFLEKEMGWTGIVAEPHPDFTPQVRANRGCYISEKCVYSRTGDLVEFLASSVGEYSRIAAIEPNDRREHHRKDFKSVMIETISLNDLLVEANAPGKIDYISVDTEGSEFEILQAFDFGKWDVKRFSVEHNHTPMRQKIFDFLTQHGYERKWPQFSHFDDWYVKAS